jgi:hypothetical protein
MNRRKQLTRKKFAEQLILKVKAKNANAAERIMQNESVCKAL